MAVSKRRVESPRTIPARGPRVNIPLAFSNIMAHPHSCSDELPIVNSPMRVRPSFLSGFLGGLKSYLVVPTILGKYRLWHYLVAPAVVSLLLSVILFSGVLYSAVRLSGAVDGWVEVSVGWLDQLITVAVGIVMAFVMLAVFVFLHRRIVLVVLAPLLSRLAELTVRGIEGHEFKATLDFQRALRRGLHINSRSILIELSATLGLVVLGIAMPVISPLTSCMVFLVESRFAGLGLIDFPLEYRGLSVADSVAYAKAHRGTATGLGAGYFLLMTIPVVGWMLAPTFGTIAGTVETLEQLNRGPDLN